MKAIRYRIDVCEGTLALVHDAYQTITEIYVPEFNLYINGMASFIHDGDDRIPPETDDEEVDVDVMEVMLALRELADANNTKKRCEEVIRNHFKLEST